MADDETVGSVRSEPQGAETHQVTIKIVPPESYVYSNVAAITVTPWDIRLNFADVRPGEEGDAKTVAGVILPPEHAAGLAILLTTQLHNFEKQFGLIRHAGWSSARDAAIKRQSEELKQPT